MAITFPAIITVHPGTLPLQCCTYALLGPSGVVLIDPGSGYFEAEVDAGLQAHGISPSAVTAVLLTHYHIDHARGVGRWQRFGSRLYASAGTAEALLGDSPEVWGDDPMPKVKVDEVVTDGKVLDVAGVAIDCVATPGHTAACMTFVVCLAEGKAAFTGDVLMYDCQPGWAGGPDFSEDALLHSLERLQDLQLARVYPGHDAVEGDVAEWLAAGERLGRAGQWRLKR